MAEKRNVAAFTMWSKPDFGNVVRAHKAYRTNYNSAMLYAHYEMSANEMKKEVIKYLKKKDPSHHMLSRIKDMHDNRFLTIGKYMFVLNNGGELPDDLESRVYSVLDTIVTEEEARLERVKIAEALEAEKKQPVVAATVRDRVLDKSNSVIGEIEEWIDAFSNDTSSGAKTVEDFVNLFKLNDVKAIHASHIASAFVKRHAEYKEVGGSDKFINEAYSCFSKVEMRRLVAMMDNLATACNMISEVAKATRAPKVKKAQSVDKVVAKLKYKKDDAQLGIVSVNPVQLVGAQIVWVYNTRTRKLSHYKAAGPDGIGVKGSMLVNFSDDSMEKTLRKPIDTLGDFKKSSKVKLRTFLEEINTVSTRSNGKITEHHILLRVDK